MNINNEFCLNKHHREMVENAVAGYEMNPVTIFVVDSSLLDAAEEAAEKTTGAIIACAMYSSARVVDGVIHTSISKLAQVLDHLEFA